MLLPGMTRKNCFVTIASRHFEFFRISSYCNVDIDIGAIDRRFKRRQASHFVLTLVTYRQSGDDQ